MKKLLSILLLATTTLIASAVAQSDAATQSAPPKPASGSTADKAHTLINNMIKALGGEKYLTYNTLEQEGRTYSFYKGEANSAGTVFWRFWQFPDKDRIELTKQRDVVYLHLGDKGYEITFKGTAQEEKEQLEDYLRRRSRSLEIVTREWLKDPATILIYLGTAVADQRAVEQVSIINNKNEEVTLGIDPQTFLPLSKTFTFRDKEKFKNEDVEIYANYKNVDGIMTPHTISRRRNGDMVNQRFLTAVRYNTPLDEAMFNAKVTYDPWKRSGPRQ